MASQPMAAQKLDVSSSLPIAIASLLLPTLGVMLGNAAELPDSTVAQIGSTAFGLPVVAALTLRHFKTSRQLRALQIVRNDLAVSPTLVAFALAASLVLADSLLGFIIGVVAGATAAASADFGATVEIQNELARQGLAFGSVFVAIPALGLFSLFAARRAAHYIRGRKLPWLILAGALYVLVRVLILIAAGSYVRELGLDTAILSFTFAYVLVAVVMVVIMWIGALWANRTHESFVGARLLTQLAPSNRQAALDLLRESVPRST